MTNSSQNFIETFPKLAPLSNAAADYDVVRRAIAHIRGHWRTQPEIDDIAAYFASQKGSVGAADPKIVARGEALFRGGNLEKGLPACTGCHSPNGAGNAAAGFPHLGGQHAQYVGKQLTEFRKEEGGRTNDGDTKPMQSIAKKLSDEDIAAVSSYIQGLH